MKSVTNRDSFTSISSNVAIGWLYTGLYTVQASFEQVTELQNLISSEQLGEVRLEDWNNYKCSIPNLPGHPVYEETVKCIINIDQ